jgi:hypothetical protein
MAEASPDKIVIGIFGPLITAVIGAAIGWLPGGLTGAIGQPLTTLLAAVGGVSGLVFSLMYKRYIGVLGAGGGRKGYPAREAYEALRASLSGGNLAARLYADWLTKALDSVDRFFGDAGKADQTLFPRVFGLKTPTPLWTAPAFDRILLLALIYPIVTISMIWAVSGHVGPAEAALELKADLAGWQRGLAVGLIWVSILSIRRGATPKKGFITPIWFAIITFASVFAAWSILATANAIAIALCLGVVAAAARAAPGAFVVAFTLVLAVTYNVGSAGFAGFGFAFAVPLAFASVIPVAVVVLNHTAIERRRQGVFLSLYLFAMIIICFWAANWLAHLKTWGESGVLLLFFGLLTLINAPFDWASLGLTRALLRRGLELGAWWPYVLALVDALAAAIIIALLALTMVIGVQTFDYLAERAGGPTARILPLDKLFDGIAAQPLAPEYWWAYALLLSTMIPSLLNLMIGGASLLRGIPGLPALLLRFMPAGKAVPAFDRAWLALVLTSQVFVGAFLGIAAQFVLAIGVIFYLLPWVGLELLETARAVAEFDLPMKVLGLWWGDQ